MENSIHKMRAAHLILSAILTMQGEDAPAFSTHCDTIDNLCETVMSVLRSWDIGIGRFWGCVWASIPIKDLYPRKCANIWRLRLPLK